MLTPPGYLLQPQMCPRVRVCQWQCHDSWQCSTFIRRTLIIDLFFQAVFKSRCGHLLCLCCLKEIYRTHRLTKSFTCKPPGCNQEIQRDELTECLKNMTDTMVWFWSITFIFFSLIIKHIYIPVSWFQYCILIQYIWNVIKCLDMLQGTVT